MATGLELLSGALANLTGGTARGWQARAFRVVRQEGKVETDGIEDGMFAYLERRYEAAQTRAEFSKTLSRARARGLERFAPDLDKQLDVVREQVESDGGLTAKHERELGWPDRDKRGGRE